MGLQGEKTREMFQRASRVIPHGVNSNFRYWGDEDTLIITRGEGAYIWDADGKRYIDYRLGFGPLILGHAYPAVLERVNQAMQSGTLFAWTSPQEIELAERLAKVCGLGMVRLTNTGTEATMHALRIARAHTGRERFIKFEGQYHGMVDYFMYSSAGTPPGSMGPRESTKNVQMTRGIPAAISQYVINLPFNDVELLEKAVAAHADELAAIIVEPILGNVASIMPQAGFLEAIRSLCDQHGIMMIMDEVKTGFRVALGGAQQYFGIQADLVTYAKSMGNGFPIAAIGGKSEVMMTIEPGVVAHGGTYSGNAVGVAAALATLDVLEKESVIETINQRGQLLMSGLGEILTDAGIPHALSGPPPMFGIVLGVEQPPTDLRSFHDGDLDLYEEICAGLCERGVQPDIDAREPWFLSYSHSEADIAETLTIFEEAVRAAKK